MTAAHTVYAVPDLHGHLDYLRGTLDLVDLDDPSTQLVLLGDYIDRGPNSAGVLQLVRATQDRYPEQVVALLGNHEVDFLDWLDGDDPIWLLADPDWQTTRSFLPADVVDAARGELVAAECHGRADPGVVERINATIKREISNRHGDLLDWLRRLPLHYETDSHIYVHAGIDEEAGEMWKLGTDDLTFTHKYPPSFGAHEVGKLIVAGHVGTREMHADHAAGPYRDEGHLYLDGSPEQPGGQLNVARYDTNSRTWDFYAVTRGGVDRLYP